MRKYKLEIFKSPHYMALITSPEKVCVIKHLYSGHPEIKPVESLEVKDEEAAVEKFTEIVRKDISLRVPKDTKEVAILDYGKVGVYIVSKGINIKETDK